MRRLVLILGLLGACELDERNDFLVGRECTSSAECDPGDQCLAHRWTDRPEELRCRSTQSFNRSAENEEPPLAYCNEDEARDAGLGDGALALHCPEGTVCRADRVRPLDGSIRREVCQLPSSPFGPPP